MGFPCSCFSIYSIYLLFHPTAITLDVLKTQMSHFITGLKELTVRSINDYYGTPRIYPEPNSTCINKVTCGEGRHAHNNSDIRTHVFTIK